MPKDTCRKGHSEFYFRKSGQRRCRICDRITARKSWLKGAERYRINQNEHGWTLRKEVLNAMGGKCVCCGADRLEFLSVDHINNDGSNHRKEIGGAKAIYRWLKKNNYPEGFQVLCMNCNCAKSWYGICPHEKDRKAAQNDISEYYRQLAGWR